MACLLTSYQSVSFASPLFNLRCLLFFVPYDTYIFPWSHELREVRLSRRRMAYGPAPSLDANALNFTLSEPYDEAERSLPVEAHFRGLSL